MNVEKLEEILVANWASFINPTKLMAWVMLKTRENLDTHFIVVSDADFSNRASQITVSRCQLLTVSPGFLLWIDFTLPYDGNVAVGTIEAFVSISGQLTVSQVTGNLYQKTTSNNV